MATNYLIPNLGATGAITLKDPFAGLCAANVPYKVSSVRTMQDIVANGADPYNTYYAPYSISEEKFAQDVKDGVVIISLLSPTGETVSVPNSYLANLPVATGIPYATMLVGINLGPLPLDLNLAYFMTVVQNAARDLLGVENADIKVGKATSTTYLSIADSTAIETARKAVMDTVVTDAAKLYASEQARLALQQKNADLEAFILKNVKPT